MVEYTIRLPSPASFAFTSRIGLESRVRSARPSGSAVRSVQIPERRTRKAILLPSQVIEGAHSVAPPSVILFISPRTAPRSASTATVQTSKFSSSSANARRAMSLALAHAACICCPGPSVAERAQPLTRPFDERLISHRFTASPSAAANKTRFVPSSLQSSGVGRTWVASRISVSF